VRGIRTAEARTPCEDSASKAVTAAARLAACDQRGAGDGHERLVRADQCGAECRHRVGLFGEALFQRISAAVVATEGKADDPVGPLCPIAQDIEVGEGAVQGLSAGGFEGGCGAGRTGEPEDGVAVSEQLGDDGGADRAGATGDEDVHGNS